MSEFSEAQKQFILGALAQQSQDLRGEMRRIRTDLQTDIKAVKRDVCRLDVKIDTLSESVAEALTNVDNANEKRFTRCENRLTKLERVK